MRAVVQPVSEAQVRVEQQVVEQGIFQADMQVSLINDGPVTILIDSPKRF